MNREKKVRELQNLLRASLSKKITNRCVAHNLDGTVCDETAISSHTIQKRAGLKAIAEDGHVFQIKHARSGPPDKLRNFGFQKVGVNKASVFPGFCAHHDNSLFKSVEAPHGSITESDLKLLAYRTICMELFKKIRVVRSHALPPVKKLVQELEIADDIQAFLLGTRLAINDLEKQKVAFEELLNGSGNIQFRATLFYLDYDLPFTFAGAFAPEFDFHGKLILPPPTEAWGSASVYVGHLKGMPVASLQCLDTVDHHNIGSFFSSQSDLNLESIGGMLLQMAIEYSENSFFNISWVNNLIPEVREELIQRFGAGTPGEPNSNKANISSQFDIIRIGAKKLEYFPPATDPRVGA